MRVRYPKCAYGQNCELNPILNGVYMYIWVEVSFYIPNRHTKSSFHIFVNIQYWVAIFSDEVLTLISKRHTNILIRLEIQHKNKIIFEQKVQWKKYQNKIIEWFNFINYVDTSIVNNIT